MMTFTIIEQHCYHLLVQISANKMKLRWSFNGSRFLPPMVVDVRPSRITVAKIAKGVAIIAIEVAIITIDVASQ